MPLPPPQQPAAVHLNSGDRATGLKGADQTFAPGAPEPFSSLAALQALTFRFKADGNLAVEPKVWK